MVLVHFKCGDLHKDTLAILVIDQGYEALYVLLQCK